MVIGILVILIIALAFYFGFWNRRAPTSTGGSTNVQVNTPGGSSAAPGTSGGSSGGTSGGGY
ncbi:hypothetical protein KW790_02780 [Candidatus Parcubacteria bacterium]|nr:hypothetical protein [Candidatus Parcubacteria bacterium]